MSIEQQTTGSLPRYADVVVVGGGTSGAVIAGRLAEQEDRTVLLLEAGPDYGPFADGRWPAPLLDARAIPWFVHDWAYTSSARYGEQNMPLQRARVLGGCSAHNGCAAIWGSRLDYDAWERAGNSGWGAEALLPFFRQSMQRLRVRTPRPEEATPWHRAVLASAPAAGLPLAPDLNDLDEDVGVGLSPVNVADGVRWNTAFAYLDPVRARPTLTIRGGVLVDRVVVEHGTAVALDVIGPSGPARVQAGHIVLSAGAFGSPAILLRSGIGDPAALQALDIAALHPSPA